MTATKQRPAPIFPQNARPDQRPDWLPALDEAGDWYSSLRSKHQAAAEAWGVSVAEIAALDDVWEQADASRRAEVKAALRAGDTPRAPVEDQVARSARLDLMREAASEMEDALGEVVIEALAELRVAGTAAR